MKTHPGGRLFVVAAVLSAVAVFAVALFVALEVRSVAAGPHADPLKPNPGHEWSEIELPVGTWLGLDADTVDGKHASDLQWPSARLQCPPRRVPVNVHNDNGGQNLTLFRWCDNISYTDHVELTDTSIYSPDGGSHHLAYADDLGCAPFCQELGFWGDGRRIASVDENRFYFRNDWDEWEWQTEVPGARASACACYP